MGCVWRVPGPIRFYFSQFKVAVKKRYLLSCPEECVLYQRGEYCEHVTPGETTSQYLVACA